MPSCLNSHKNRLRVLSAGYLYSRPGFCIALPIVISALLIVVTIAVVHPAFATIDDARVLYVNAGYASGSPEGTYLFSNALWGNLLAALYGLVPEINWYVMYQIFCVLIASSMLGVSLLHFGKRAGVSLVPLAGVGALLFVVMFQNAIMLMHFEVCAAMMGVSGITLLLLSDWVEKEAGNVACRVLSVFLMLICYAQEENTFYASLTFYLLAAFYQAMSATRFAGNQAKKKTIVRSILPPVAVMVGAVILLQINNASMGLAWEDYLEYNPYRIAFWDYPHETFSENPSVYASAGWSEEFYNATQYMYFMDDRFDADSLSKIVEPFSRGGSSIDESPLTSIPAVLYKLFKTEVLARWQLLLGTAVFLSASSVFVRTRRQRGVLLEGLLCLGAALLSIVLCLYLAWRGRLPLRAWEVIALPGITVCLFALFKLYLANKGVSDKSGSRMHAGSICLAVALLAIACVGLSDVEPYTSRLNSSLEYRHEMNDHINAVEQYAMAHPDKVFVTGYYYQNYNPFTCYQDEKPTNVVAWGSSYYMTPVYLDQMSGIGRGRLSSSNLLEDDVYLIVNSNSSEDVETVYSMLVSDYGATTMEFVESVDSVMKVYKVS